MSFTGFLRGRVFKQALAEVHAVVMPSIWEETFGMAAMEQMMRGRLVLASDTGGLGELVADVGLKFRAGNTDELTGCMERVLREPHLVREMGLKARVRALRLFAQERMIEDHMALYRRILGLPNADAPAQTQAQASA